MGKLSVPGDRFTSIIYSLFDGLKFNRTRSLTCSLNLKIYHIVILKCPIVLFQKEVHCCHLRSGYFRFMYRPLFRMSIWRPVRIHFSKKRFRVIWFIEQNNFLVLHPERLFLLNRITWWSVKLKQISFGYCFR